jgi:hypothetical protein
MQTVWGDTAEMTLLPTEPAGDAETVTIAELSLQPVPAAVPAPVFITEQEVLLGSAAAAGLQFQRAPRWWSGLARACTKQARDDRWKARSYPAREWYLEDSRMNREMHHL